MSEIEIIMAKGIQKYIEHEEDLFNEIVNLTHGTQWEITSKEELVRYPPPILFYYLTRASKNISKLPSEYSLTGNYSYPFVTEKDLKEYVNSDIIQNIVSQVIELSNKLFSHIYLPAQSLTAGKKFPDSLKVLNSTNTWKIKRGNYTNTEIKGLPKPAPSFACKKTQFMDFMTDFINTEKIFNNEKSTLIARFQYLINKFFTNLKNEYVLSINKTGLININSDDILFIYKGGTTMKILFDKYANLYQGTEFAKTFKDNFKRSDSDYAYIINPELDKSVFNVVYYHTTKLAILGLKYIKKVLLDNLDFFMDYSSLKTSDFEELLTKINTKLNSIRGDFADPEKRNELLKQMNCDELLKIDKFIGLTTHNFTVKTEPIPKLNRENTYFIETSDDNQEEEASRLYYRRKFYGKKRGMSNIDESDSMSSTSTSAKDRFILDGQIEASRTDIFITKNNIKMDEAPLIGSLDYLSEDKTELDIDSELYITVNESPYSIAEYGLDSDGNQLGNKRLSFFLSRIKLNFVFYYRTTDNKYGFIKIPSEVVDLSISKQDSYDTYLSYKNLNMKYNKYRYVYNKSNKNNSLTIDFLGLSPNGFIFDINKMFFVESSKVWEVGKYLKRLSRLIYFSILYLKNMRINLNELIPLMNDYLLSARDRQPDSQDKFMKLISFFTSKNLDNKNSGLVDVIKYINKIYVNGPRGSDSDEVKRVEFINSMIETYTKILGYESKIQNISDYSISTLDKSTDYVPINSLGGGFFNLIN